MPFWAKDPSIGNRWIARYKCSDNSFYLVRALAVDSAGNVYVTCDSDGITTIKHTQNPSIEGDFYKDGDIDRDDIDTLLDHRNSDTDHCPECDMDGDGMITTLDARKLVLLSTRPRCAVD